MILCLEVDNDGFDAVRSRKQQREGAVSSNALSSGDCCNRREDAVRMRREGRASSLCAQCLARRQIIPGKSVVSGSDAERTACEWDVMSPIRNDPTVFCLRFASCHAQPFVSPSSVFRQRYLEGAIV